MKDRVPKYPGRVKLTPIPGQTDTFDLTRADEASEAGSAYSKGNVLPDSLCDTLGLDSETAEPKDALGKIGQFVRVGGNTYKNEIIDRFFLISSPGQSNVYSTAETDDFIYWTKSGNTTNGTPIMRLNKSTMAVDSVTVPANWHTTSTGRAQWVSINVAHDNLVYFNCYYDNGSSSGYSDSKPGIASFTIKTAIRYSATYCGYDTQNRRMNFIEVSGSNKSLVSVPENFASFRSPAFSYYTSNSSPTACTCSQYVFMTYFKGQYDNLIAAVWNTVSNTITEIAIPIAIRYQNEIRDFAVCSVKSDRVVGIYNDGTNWGTFVFRFSTNAFTLYASALPKGTTGVINHIGIDKSGIVYFQYRGYVVKIGTDDKIISVAEHAETNGYYDGNYLRCEGCALLHDRYALGAFSSIFFDVKNNVRSDLIQVDVDKTMVNAGRHVGRCRTSEPWILSAVDDGYGRIYSEVRLASIKDIPNLMKRNVFQIPYIGERIV